MKVERTRESKLRSRKHCRRERLIRDVLKLEGWAMCDTWQKRPGLRKATTKPPGTYHPMIGCQASQSNAFQHMRSRGNETGHRSVYRRLGLSQAIGNETYDQRLYQWLRILCRMRHCQRLNAPAVANGLWKSIVPVFVRWNECKVRKAPRGPRVQQLL